MDDRLSRGRVMVPNPTVGGPSRTRIGRPGRLAASAALLASLAGVLAGCETDSFMDPSVVGRWENTPTIVPILERIDVVERDTGEFVDVTPVMPEDLLPEASEYRIGPGDVIVVIILDFYEAGREARFELFVDTRGYVALPQIGEVYVSKLTRTEVEQSIADAVKEGGLLEDPLVDVQVPGSRQATFSIFGVVDRVGRYAVPSPDYRLLEAITDAGGVSPSIDKIYIIRQVALTDDDEPAKPGAAKTPARPTPPPSSTSKAKPAQGQDLLEVIEELTEPGDIENSEPPAEQPAVFPSTSDSNHQSSLDAALDPEVNPGVMATDRRPVGTGRRSPSGASASAMRQDTEPPIDLVDQDPVTLPAPTPSGAISSAVAGQGKWVFLNGEWVRVIQQTTASDQVGGLPEGEDPLDAAPKTADDVLTQRVIEVPVAPLIQGVAQYNLVIRAGDAISVPGPQQGFVYLSGPGIARPGVYQFPFTGKLTLQRLIASAGGLSAIAIPERVDLVRMVGDDRQATIRLNLRAIAEGSQPDLFLKPDDLVNVGTNFWATPLAVIRGGFRASYGFGFLLDRNFGNDVFGAPPDDNPFN